MSTSQEEEQALERLLRSGRSDPDDAQLRRLEDRFDNWLENASPSSKGYGAATATRGIHRILPLIGASLAVLGISFFSISSKDDRVATVKEDRRSSVASERVTLANEPNRPARLSTHEPALLPTTRPPVRVVAPRELAGPSKESASPVDPALPVELASPVEPAPPSQLPGEAAIAEKSETEVSYLRRARAALKSDPAQALELANGHPLRFPHGALDQEREVVAIDALVRLGRRGESRARADAFRARYPSSAHLTRLDALVGGSP